MDKVVLVDMDGDVSELKGSAVIVGVASSVSDASIMIARPDINVVLLSDNIYDFLQRINAPIDVEAKEEDDMSSEWTVADIIGKIFTDIGFTPNLLGYSYLRECLIYTSSRDYLPMLTKELYVHVARVCDAASVGTVDRNIRTLISTRWKYAPIRVKSRILGNALGSREVPPTPAEAISAFTRHINNTLHLHGKKVCG